MDILHLLKFAEALLETNTESVGGDNNIRPGADEPTSGGRDPLGVAEATGASDHAIARAWDTRAGELERILPSVRQYAQEHRKDIVAQWGHAEGGSSAMAQLSQHLSR